MIDKATDLDQAYRACNPDVPLAADDPRYCDLAGVRGTRHIARSLARSIRRSTGQEHLKMLLTGHRGSGKSTELLRVQAELQREGFFAVYMDVETMLDLVDVSYLDVLVAIAKETEKALREEAGIQLPPDLLAAIADWFADKVLEREEGQELRGEVKTQAQAGADIPFFARLMARVTAEAKSASSRRVHTRQQLERELSVFLEHLNRLIDAAQERLAQAGRRGLVLIVDGLEKMHYTVNREQVSSHAELFVHHAEQLQAPACHVVYTTPISLAYNANLGNDFDPVIVLPMVKTHDEGLKALVELIACRVELDQVFQDRGLAKELARLSGGVVRDLIRLVRLATDTDEPRIGRAEVDFAMATLTREYDRLVRNADLERLREVRAWHRVQADEAYARLLNLRLVLEYQNGERWADLHPALDRVSWVKKGLQGGG